MATVNRELPKIKDNKTVYLHENLIGK